MLSLDLRPSAADRADMLEKRVQALQVKLIQLQPLSGRGGWWPMTIREPYTGAWQRNEEIAMDTALAFSALFACTTLIMSDIGKLTLRLVEQDANGIWNEIENPAYSPVLRRPNRYQNSTQFIETWIASKLNSGNTYVLKERHSSTVVRALYVLDPLRVTPLVAPDGSVYYELKRDDISGLPQEKVTVPASEIIHDRFNCLFHPLVGLSPIFACALAARQGLSIQNNSKLIFANGSVPGGTLTTPHEIPPEAAARLKEQWETEFTGDNIGKVAILGSGLEYKPLAYNAVDMQLIEQLKWTAETVCSCYHVPPYLVDVGPPPPYANVEPVIQKYYSQCLQTLMNALEKCLDEGLGLGRSFGNAYGTELDPDDLIWLDAEAKTKAAADGVGSGAMSPNEARRRYFALGPVTGGESPYLQQQNYALSALAKRDAAEDPFAKPNAKPPASENDEGDVELEEDAFDAMLSKLFEMEAV